MLGNLPLSSPANTAEPSTASFLTSQLNQDTTMKRNHFSKLFLLLATFSLILCDGIQGAGAEPGFSAADAKVAEQYLEEGAKYYDAGKMEDALSCFLRASKMGNARGHWAVGRLYEVGAGVRQDYATAAAWYRKAADQGNAVAMTHLGRLYENGKGVPEDWKQAARWYRMGAEKNHAPAESALAAAYQFGIGVPQNRAESIYWNKRAIDHGDASCKYWERWLRNPTNFVGFRNDRERDLVMGNQLRTSPLLCGADPAGQTFLNSAERLACLRGLRKAVDIDEKTSQQAIAKFQQQQKEAQERREKGIR